MKEPRQAYETIQLGHYAVIELSDDGKGMDDKILSHMFETGFSTHCDTEKSGSGLGLMVVREVVKRHKGFVDVKSERGKGTTFRVYLPLS